LGGESDGIKVEQHWFPRGGETGAGEKVGGGGKGMGQLGGFWGEEVKKKRKEDVILNMGGGGGGEAQTRHRGEKKGQGFWSDSKEKSSGT